MPQRPDLRQISGNIREALADCDRETLLDMLTFVFKEYVVEGPPPLLVGQSERIPDLEGLTFAQLIRTLQTRLDMPELNLFQVDGEQVSVRVGGVMTPLDASRARGGAEPPAPAAAPATPGQPGQPRQQRPGVHIIEAQVPMQPPRGRAERAGSGEQGAPARSGARPDARPDAGQANTEQAGAGQGTAPPPRRGLSVRGRPGAGAAPRQASSQPGQAGQPGQPGTQPSSSPPARSSGSAADQSSNQSPSQSGDEDIASTRFSLLELD